MQAVGDTGRIHTEIFIYGYRVSGVFDTRKRLLAEVLYDPTTSFLMVQEAYLSPIGDPMKISMNYPIALLIKDKISLILTMNIKDGLRSDQRYYRGSYETALVIALPFFEVTGKLYSTSRFKLETFMGVQAGTFITLVNATARSTFHPDISYQGGTALINTTHVRCIGEKIS